MSAVRSPTTSNDLAAATLAELRRQRAVSARRSAGMVPLLVGIPGSSSDSTEAPGYVERGPSWIEPCNGAPSAAHETLSPRTGRPPMRLHGIFTATAGRHSPHRRRCLGGLDRSVRTQACSCHSRPRNTSGRQREFDTRVGRGLMGSNGSICRVRSLVRRERHV